LDAKIPEKGKELVTAMAVDVQDPGTYFEISSATLKSASLVG
jgi:hypothetical protein